MPVPSKMQQAWKPDLSQISWKMAVVDLSRKTEDFCKIESRKYLNNVWYMEISPFKRAKIYCMCTYTAMFSTKEEISSVASYTA